MIIPKGTPGVPQVVSRFQGCAALYLVGLYDQVEAYMADENTEQLTKIAWNTAQEFRRNSPTIAAVTALLGLTEDQVDNLFIVAGGIEA